MTEKINIPKVSVILTSFNHAKYLREAIDSTLSQTYENFELIIWDDASTDESWEIIQSYKDSRIKAFRNEKQKRGIYGINKAIFEVAQGEYIAIHHSDDVWTPNKLDEQVKFLDANHQFGAIFTNVKTIDDDGNDVIIEDDFVKDAFDKKNRSRQQWLRYFFDNGNALCHPSVLIRKKCYFDCGGYRYGLAQLGDFDMWIRLCMKYEIYVSPQKLIKFRVQKNRKNTSAPNEITMVRLPIEFMFLTDSFFRIEAESDYFEVFPELSKKLYFDIAEIRLALAWLMVDISQHRFIKIAGLNYIFRFGVNDEEAGKKLISKTGKNLIFADDEIPLDVLNLKSKIKTLESSVSQLNKELSSMYALHREFIGSTSWKLTQPLRNFKTLINKVILPGKIKSTILINNFLKKSTKPRSVCAIVHVFYIDIFEYIMERLNEIKFPHVRLIVTTHRDKYELVLKEVKKFNINCEVVVVENRGRDILPFLESLKKVSSDELILKLHTKKSPHRSDGEQWGRELIDSLTDSSSLKNGFNAFKDNNRLGMIIADGHALSLGDRIDENKEKFNLLVEQLNLSQQSLIEGAIFPAGSMFLARSEAIRAILNLNLDLNSFECEEGQVDGTLAHAVERLLGLVILSNGFSLGYTSSPHEAIGIIKKSPFH